MRVYLKKLRNVLISIFVLLCVFISASAVLNVKAEEIFVTYWYEIRGDDLNAQWYEGMRNYLVEDVPIDTTDMILDEYTQIYVNAEPTEDVLTFLSSLDNVYLLAFWFCGDTTITIGNDTNKCVVERIDIESPETTFQIYASNLFSFESRGGIINLTGDVSEVYLGVTQTPFLFSDYWRRTEYNVNYGTNQVTTINGNVNELTWLKDDTNQYFVYKGTCTVNGSITNPLIKECKELVNFGVITPSTKILSNIHVPTIIEDGVLDSSITCTSTDFENVQYTFHYNCYAFSYNTANDWYMTAYGDGQYLGDKYLENFDPALIPDNSYLFVGNTYGDIPITISSDLEYLQFSSGNIIVQGDVNNLQGYCCYGDGANVEFPDNIQINGSINWMLLAGAYKDLNVNVTGTITSGTLVMMPNTEGVSKTLMFSSDGSNPQIMTQGKLNLMGYNPNDASGVEAILASPRDVENAIGITGDIITDADGNVLAVETASIGMSANTLTSTEKNQIEVDGDVTILESVDLSVSKGYLDTRGNVYTGVAVTNVEELNIPITITLQIPEGTSNSSDTLSILRVHGDETTELLDLDADPGTITFETDKFSTYAIAKPGAPEQSTADTDNSPSDDTSNATSTSTSTAQGENASKVVGLNGAVGWEAIIKQFSNLNNLEEGKQVEVLMSGTTYVPGSVFKAIQGKNKKLILHMNNLISWMIDGESLAGVDLKNLYLGVIRDSNSIPEDIMIQLGSPIATTQLSLEYTGEFGFPMIMNINLDSDYKGYYANLYYYNPITGQLEYVTSDLIHADGNADLRFTHASDYVVTVTKEVLSNELDSVPKTGESYVSWIIVLAVISGIAIVFFYKKEKESKGLV